MKIVFTKSSEKELLALQKSTRDRIFHKISSLANDPFPYGSQKLEGGAGYRIRVGDYRVIYQILKGKLTIVVIRIRHRKDVYR